MIFPDNSASWEPAGGFEEGDGMIPEIGRGVPLIKVMGVGGGAASVPVRRALSDTVGPQPDAGPGRRGPAGTGAAGGRGVSFGD